jgi:Mg-chelatase subunit ChlD
MTSAEVGRFRLLASAVAGRLVEVEAGGEGPTWTDGATIYVDAAAPPREQLRSVTVQAALLGAGSLRADVVGTLARKPTIARRYLAVEGHRALAAHDAVLPDAVRSQVDERIATRADSPAASLAIASSRDTVDDPPAWFGTMRPRQIRRALEDVDRAVRAQVQRRRDEPPIRELDEDRDDEGPDLSGFSSPVGGGGSLGRLLKRMLRDARSPHSGPPGNDAATHVTRRRANAAGTARATTGRAEHADRTDTPERNGTTYPEWDVRRGRYRPAWCTVFERDAALTEPGIRRASADTGALRQPLARLGLDLERRHRQLQGDDIDIDAAVEAYVDAAAGSAPDEAVYVDSVRRRRDLAALILLDVSGSAGEPSTTGLAVHEHQLAAATALARTLHDLGDRVAVYAFRSQGRAAVNIERIKRFDEAFDARVLRRLDGLVPGAYTRLGAAIRHGAARLETQGGAQRRLLVVLSDGFAYDHGYEGIYAEADARRALAEARRRGMGCLCLSVGAGIQADALQRVFGTSAHASVPRGEYLAGVIGPLFRAALQSAERQQSVWQRRVRTQERLAIERGLTTSGSS